MIIFLRIPLPFTDFSDPRRIRFTQDAEYQAHIGVFVLCEVHFCSKWYRLRWADARRGWKERTRRYATFWVLSGEYRKTSLDRKLSVKVVIERLDPYVRYKLRLLRCH